MKILQAKIFALKIPFRFSFGHFLKIRVFSNSFVVELTTDSGIRGYGEGVARPYLTGETPKRSFKHIKSVLLPAVMDKKLPCLLAHESPIKTLEYVDTLLPELETKGIIQWNGARSAVELAILDCMLKSEGKSLNKLLPSKLRTVTYSSVFASGSVDQAKALAIRTKEQGMRFIKIKVGKKNDLDRIMAVRDIVGPEASIRLDANGAFSVSKAIEFAQSVQDCRIDCLEQPVGRGNVEDLITVKVNSPVPIMADESLVSLDDAKILADRQACDYFNLRIAKCGGLYRTLLIAGIARTANLKCQVGCLVGETAILSAAGRHLAANLPDVRFVEGSYGTHLLEQDIAAQETMFGNSGEAPALDGPGLGIDIRMDVLTEFAKKIESIP